jgi:hypothetical protein
MCDPVSLTVAATIASTAAVGYGASVQAGQAKYEAKLADRNAKQRSEAARESEKRGMDERKQLFRQLADARGKTAAAQASGGVDLGFGSARTVQEDMLQLGNEDVSALNTNIFDRTKGLLIDASNYRARASAQRSAAKSAMTAGYINMFSTALGGASSIARYKAKGAVTEGAGKNFGASFTYGG